MLARPGDDVEVWLPAVGYPSYDVSSHGRIRRAWHGLSNNSKPKILKPSTYGRYLRQTFYVDGKPRWDSVHRVVLTAFVGPPPSPIHEGAHDDGDNRNNRLSNLFWKTPKENAADRIRHGTQACGVSHPNTRLTQRQIDAIRKINNRGIGYGLIAEAVGIGATSAARIVRGKTYR